MPILGPESIFFLTKLFFSLYYIRIIEYRYIGGPTMKQEISLFKALSDETRLRITVLLSEKELCVCQLMWALDLDQVKVSRHLTVLRNAGLVNDRREGLWIFYSLAEPRNELEKFVFSTFKNYFRKTDLFTKDIKNMKKCIQIPVKELNGVKK